MSYAVTGAVTFIYSYRLLGVPRNAVYSLSILYLLIQIMVVVILVLPQMVNALSLDTTL